MGRLFGLSVFLLASLLVLGAAGAAYAGTGPLAAPHAHDATAPAGENASPGGGPATDGDQTTDAGTPDRASDDAALVDFVATGSTCETGDEPGGRTSVSSSDGITRITINRSMTVPSAGYRLEASDLEQTGPTNYTLHVSSVATEKPAVQCVASAHYVAHVRLPQPTDGRDTLTVYEDGEQAMTVWNAAHASGGSASASASAGGSASSSVGSSTGNDTAPANETTAAN